MARLLPLLLVLLAPALARAQSIRVTQTPTEVVVAPDPSVLVTQAVLDVVIAQDPTVRVTQAVVEVVLLETDVPKLSPFLVSSLRKPEPRPEERRRAAAARRTSDAGDDVWRLPLPSWRILAATNGDAP